MIADNRLAETSQWDDKLLAQQLKELSLLDLDFSLETSGFEMAEIDVRIESLTGDRTPEGDPADVFPRVPDQQPTSQAGDLWLLGRHRILCLARRALFLSPKILKTPHNRFDRSSVGLPRSCLCQSDRRSGWAYSKTGHGQAADDSLDGARHRTGDDQDRPRKPCPEHQAPDLPAASRSCMMGFRGPRRTIQRWPTQVRRKSTACVR
jgi:hypothetical protein